MTRVLAAVLAGLLLLGGAAPALAVDPDERLADPALEARARDISKGLRCLVCQNQNIDDSNASLAKDLRILVRERLSAGDSDDQVRAYLVNRYGDFVLLDPPFKRRTLVLWLGAPALLLLAGAALWLAGRRRPKIAAPAPLSPEERAKLEALLGARRD